MTDAITLADAAADRLASARHSSDGRSSLSLHDGETSVLRQTMTALLGGRRMELDHPPDEAWLLVVEGSVDLEDGRDGQQLRTGELVRLPRAAHVITARDDSVLLLTVAKGERPSVH